MYGLVFVPTDGSLNTFDRAGTGYGFFLERPRQSLARSSQFGAGNSIWQKSRSVQYTGGGPLVNYSFDTNSIHSTATLAASYDVFSSDVGPVAIDFSSNRLAALSFSPISGAADSVALYDISNMASPVLIARHKFPIGHQSNSSYGKVVISGDRVYAINANNGVLALSIEPPKPKLAIEYIGGTSCSPGPTLSPVTTSIRRQISRRQAGRASGLARSSVTNTWSPTAPPCRKRSTGCKILDLERSPPAVGHSELAGVLLISVPAD